MANRHIFIRNKLKKYRILQKELELRTNYIADFKKILVTPLPATEDTLRRIYSNIILDMEKKARKLSEELKLLEKIIDKLDEDSKNIIYYRYVLGISWINMPQYMMYEQRTCQIYEIKALKKIEKMDIDWENYHVK